MVTIKNTGNADAYASHVRSCFRSVSVMTDPAPVEPVAAGSMVSKTLIWTVDSSSDNYNLRY